MIEVNLFSVSSADPNSMVGRCVSRSRFNTESVGVSIMEFVKGFLKENLDQLESSINNPDMVSFINSDSNMSTVDFQSLNYWLGQIGYRVTIWNVADDEENAVSVPQGVIEYNIINKNFIQDDYPTATKLTPSDSESLVDILKTVVEQTGLFNTSKLRGVKNPFTLLINNLIHEKEVSGNINYSIVSKIYQMLDQTGFNIYCATSEN